MKRKNEKTWGLYVHVPFCRSKCPYCGFYSIASTSLIPRWVKALEAEIGHWAASFNGEPPIFDTIHFGGGTPSILECGDLERIFEKVRHSLHVKDCCEIAIETDPLDISPGKARFLKQLGFSRAVVGVQSFDDATLALLGRRHCGEDGTRAVNALREAGFDNVGIDLICGTAGCSPEMWLRGLERAIALSPEHISCYCLTIEEGTVFRKMAHRGMMMGVNQEEERTIFLEGSSYLRRMGYIHYEVSNFAINRESTSRHNLKYWRREPYLGLGPSAHSFDGARRWWNIKSLKRYCESLEKGRLPIEGSEVLTGAQAALERIAMGVRTSEGFEVNEEVSRWLDLSGLTRLEAGGLLNVKDAVVAPTVEGFLFADRIPLELTL